MDETLLESLSCPFCGDDIRVEKVLQQENSALVYALLQCDECNTNFPVVEGIPIMMPPWKRLDIFAQIGKKSHLRKGILIRDICKALKNEEIETVKVAVVYSIPYYLFLTLPKYFDILGGFGKRVIRKIMRGAYFKRSRTAHAKDVLRNKKTTYRQALKLYYQDHSHFNYFFYKFGQPRFLTTIDLASIINSPWKPILDLACGQGHLMNFLSQKDMVQSVIGVDRNFFQLVLAKKYIVPDGRFICAEADEKLPFKKDTFGAIICSDAFHCFDNKVSCIGDLKEIMADNGTIILNRVGNKGVKPNEGRELSPNGYRKLFNSMKTRMIGEKSLLDNYLDKKKPNLSQDEDITQLSDKKWISIIASNNEKIFKDYGSFDKWPHIQGKLALNPHYVKVGSNSSGDEQYRFSYPNDWYEFENSLWENYAPKEVTISKGLLNSLNENKNDPIVEKYIDEFVIMGFPENYM